MEPFNEKMIQGAVDELIELINEFGEPEQYIAFNGIADEKKALLAQGMLFYAELDFLPYHFHMTGPYKNKAALTLAYSQNQDNQVTIVVEA